MIHATPEYISKINGYVLFSMMTYACIITFTPMIYSVSYNRMYVYVYM